MTIFIANPIAPKFRQFISTGPIKKYVNGKPGNKVNIPILE